MTPKAFKDAINSELEQNGFENRIQSVKTDAGYRTIFELDTEPTEDEENYFLDRFAHTPNEVEIKRNLILI